MQSAPKKEKEPIKLTVPPFLTKLVKLYFPTQQEIRERAEMPEGRRRRKPSKQQIFKEYYLPTIILGLSLVLMLSFVIGALSNAIDGAKLRREEEQQKAQQESLAAEQLATEGVRLLERAEVLAKGYDYDGAIEVLDSYNGEMSAEMTAKRAEYVNAKSTLVEHQDPTLIPNLSFHVLIADPTRAFKDQELGGSYNRNFVTTTEFSKILDHLYLNGYVLVDFESITGCNTNATGAEQYFPKSIYLPADKKPIMLTETMVNYFNYMIDGDGDQVADAKGDGFASKLVIDANGDIKAEYVDEQGQTSVGNYDLVPILEDFIKQHPDFSYRGARATLAVTGDEGVFGYRTNTAVVASKGQDYFDQQVAGAKEVVQKLRDLGYNIACYTYENKAYGKLSVQQIQADLQSWAQQVTPVIGAVDTFVFAKVSNISDYTGNAFKVMYDSGFRYFIAHGNQPYTEVNSTYVRQNRLMVTGENMQWYRDQFNGLFDCAAILEVNTRGEVPKSS